MSPPFRDRVVLITGAGRGLGRAHARLMASLGARLYVSDAGVGLDGSGSDPGPVRDLARELEGTTEVAWSSANLASREACHGLVADVLGRWGRLDVLIHSAGIVDRTPLELLDEERLRRTLSINLEAAVWLCQAALPPMSGQGYGRIVLTTSGHGLLPVDPPPLPAYALGKASQFGLMNAIALDCAAHGVLVNAIAPVAATRMYTGPDAERYAPELISPAVAFLASDRCTASGLVVRAAGGAFSIGGYAVGSGLTFDSVPTFEDIASKWDAVLRGPFEPANLST
jgi:NAD(P)-dependent dehydrogenase (short-subunit alcohol dehydrogenase family)